LLIQRGADVTPAETGSGPRTREEGGVVRRPDYRYEATTVEGFVQQLAVSYLKNGYWLYVRGMIPAGKDPARVDDKLLARYALAVSKWARYRAKLRGEAKVQYLRYGPTFLLLSTLSESGGHPLFLREERAAIRDAREHPIYFHGYSISFKAGHPHVRIASAQFKVLTDAFLAVALTAPSESLGYALRALPFEPYGPVKIQLRKLLRKINRARKAAALDKVPVEWLRTKRRVVRPFDPDPRAFPLSVSIAHS
jgi:hypothetical protein